MKIKHIKISGFRGIRDTIDLELTQGFVVICGRNGTGKSSICDAVELSLTGTIRGGSTFKETGESFQDYLWWRGNGVATSQHISIDFVDENGRITQIDRDETRTSADVDVNSFCDLTIAPNDPMKQLIRTSFIRDEDITRFSVDLPERDRFNFAKDAVGRIEFQVFAKKANELKEYADKVATEAELEYETCRSHIADLTSTLSALKSEAQSIGNVDEALSTINKQIGSNPSSGVVALNTAKEKIGTLRLALETNNALLKEWQSYFDRLNAIDNEDNKKQNSERNVEVEHLRLTRVSLLERSESLHKIILEQEANDPNMRSLAELHVHGTKLGVRNGHCPLCGQIVSDVQYKEHLRGIEEEINTSARTIKDLLQERVECVASISGIDKSINELEEAIREKADEREFVVGRLDDIRRRITDAGFEAIEDASVTTVLISNIEVARQQIVALQKAISVLEASSAYQRIAESESELTEWKNQADSLSDKSRNARGIQEKAKSVLDTIQRIGREIVDEQLSEISPLLSEMFLRLRPHVDWRKVNYRLRGDIRGFLSLTVGENLNPSFFFSSGQRRVLGLAFLLSLHLATPWSKLKTLILDDPVQHVDDYRALNLTEVLAALRQSGRQIICTVEDEGLAALLCRRLRSIPGQEGKLITMEYRPDSGVQVKSEEVIYPLKEKILRVS